MKKLFTMLVVSLSVMAFCSSAFAWSPRLEGKPDMFHSSGDPGYYIWHDDNGLHIRTTAHDQNHVFSGVIRTNGKFIDTHGSRLEQSDFYHVSSDRDTITFKFTTASGEDGLNFRIAAGNDVNFDLFMDGHRINHKRIYLGDEGWHPRSSDFSLHR